MITLLLDYFIAILVRFHASVRLFRDENTSVFYFNRRRRCFSIILFIGCCIPVQNQPPLVEYGKGKKIYYSVLGRILEKIIEIS